MPERWACVRSGAGLRARVQASYSGVLGFKSTPRRGVLLLWGLRALGGLSPSENLQVWD